MVDAVRQGISATFDLQDGKQEGELDLRSRNQKDTVQPARGDRQTDPVI